MSRGVSLHIGLNSLDPNHYDGWSGTLNACEADASSMRKICDTRGFATERLLTKDATRSAVLDRLASLASDLVSGDTLIISYSGHGGQLPDKNDEEDDGLDETWCLYDGELLDDELYRAWAAFVPGVQVAVFSDSCHSGTVIKELVLNQALVFPTLVEGPRFQPVYRAMPPEIQMRTYMANQEFYDGLLAAKAPPATPECSVLLVSGCQDNQLSQDGAFNGAFTGALIKTWANGGFIGGYEAFTKAIRKRLPTSQSPNYLAIGASNPAFASGPVFSL